MTRKVTCLRESIEVTVEPATDRITKSTDVFKRMTKMSELDHERIVALGLSVGGTVVAELILSRGGLTSSLFDARDTMRKLLTTPRPVCKWILVHNHPSGDTTPSADDIRMTKRAEAASICVGLPLIDHVIVGDGCYFSFADAWLLEVSE